jgi:hypothetical protein
MRVAEGPQLKVFPERSVRATVGSAPKIRYKTLRALCLSSVPSALSLFPSFSSFLFLRDLNKPISRHNGFRHRRRYRRPTNRNQLVPRRLRTAIPRLAQERHAPPLRHV